MSKVHHISSTSQFQTLLNSNTYVVTDFYADWCGPCKVIAPVFEQLASAETKPGRIAFAKINVDSQQGIARQYGVSAMPTFLILKSSSVVDTVRGADPAALRSAVLRAAANAAKGAARPATVFQSQGHVLGGDSNSGDRSIRANANINWSAYLPAAGFGNTVVRFVALYLTSLFSLDAYAAAEASPFSVKKRM